MSRVFSQGCYDMVHFGHTNLFRRCKAMGAYLIVGVGKDVNITRAKRQPVFKEEERIQLLKAVKWVDEVLDSLPSVTSVELLDECGAQFCIHGDDIAVHADGTDPYHPVKAADRYRELERTQGISATDLIGRMLLPKPKLGQICIAENDSALDNRIVYVAGSFDMFHTGHLDFLEAAAALGDYLIVGLHTDQTVYERKGSNHPIMNLNERTLGCLAYRCVDEVIIGAPYFITKTLMEAFKVDIVCHGSTNVTGNKEGTDPYLEPKRQGKFKLLDSGNSLTTEKIIQRVQERRQEYERRNADKQVREIAAGNVFGIEMGRSIKRSNKTKHIMLNDN